MSIIKTKNLIQEYGQCENTIFALNNVSIDLEEGEFVAIVGSSGSGKSTLLNMLGGLDFPNEGEIYVRGTLLSYFKWDDLTIFR